MRGRRRDDALRPEARFGQPQMQRVIALGRQHAVHGDQILHAADFRAQNDVVARQAILLRRLRRFDAR